MPAIRVFVPRMDWHTVTRARVGRRLMLILQIMFYSLNYFICVYKLKVSDAGGSMIIHSTFVRPLGVLTARWKGFILTFASRESRCIEFWTAFGAYFGLSVSWILEYLRKRRGPEKLKPRISSLTARTVSDLSAMIGKTCQCCTSRAVPRSPIRY